jgi:adenosylhomocysteine nucleosidase
VIAAMRDELVPLLRHVEVLEIERFGPQTIVAGRLAGERLVLTWTGEGRTHAAAGVQRLLARGALADGGEALLLGVAGGLSPGLRLGELIVAGSVLELTGGALGRRFDCAGAGRSAGFAGATVQLRVGTLVTADGILASCREKAAVWQAVGAPDPAAVDMETAPIVAALEEHRVVWSAVRAIADPAEEALPLWLPKCVGPGGVILRRRVITGLLLRPWSTPRLLALRGRVRAAAERLAEGALALLRASP